MSDLKILTDIKIPQCPVWRRRTDYLFSNSKKKGIAKHLGLLLRNCGQYDVIITPGSRAAQLYALYRTIFRKNRSKHIVLELMLDEPRKDITWKVKNFFQKLCFSSVDIIFVSSKREMPVYAKRLGLPEERIRFLPFHTNIIKPGIVSGTGGYIFSAGRTGRDFATLADAVKGLDINVIVVTDQYHLKGVYFPSNVEVYCNIPYKKYMELLHKCSMVVVPLKKLIKSTGQVVFLEAMALGKPVIATNTVGTEDYIKHGTTGILIPPEDSKALRKALLDFMENPSFYSSLAERALEQIKIKHTFEAYTGTILCTAEEIAVPK